ncbi:MAG: nitrate/nitrite transporter NrtS [Acaryochloris sp. RU_4_1]|nr:nitrate/nitrite transporter NrtS [Acaryochloris sp. SU_5_25]NJM65756.1 nitrate/nitrite transporter NrtS [Acaryochloris sp. RU_4_1]NJN38895.1 nitrate/nitrite transporter NrtS [Acaryochloridaceae cyanobacterium CSU_3_4]NJR53676.1 nitrate/nitrite transporter NrtS [Acaryochloris sp. CRU_2_0]
MRFWKGFFASLISPEVTPSAFKVAVVVGSVLFIINHGKALMTGQMNGDRWFSVALTYVVPYLVNAHGQYVAKNRRKRN